MKMYWNLAYRWPEDSKHNHFMQDFTARFLYAGKRILILFKCHNQNELPIKKMRYFNKHFSFWKTGKGHSKENLSIAIKHFRPISRLKQGTDQQMDFRWPTLFVFAVTIETIIMFLRVISRISKSGEEKSGRFRTLKRTLWWSFFAKIVTTCGK